MRLFESCVERNMRTLRLFFILYSLFFAASAAQGQELNAKVTINFDAVSNTKNEVFDELQKQLTEFMNTRQWTPLHFAQRERIECSFLITVATYSETDNSFTASLIVTSSRPVYGSLYKTTVFSTKDPDFNFMYQTHTPIEFRAESIDNNLTAMMAYWAYMIIGLDMDTFAPMGGTPYLRQAAQIVDDSQSLGYPGWKAFDSGRNRHALVNDYLDGGLETYRQLHYDYHRCALDSMHLDPVKSRDRLATALQLLKRAHEDKPMSTLPQIFTDFKRDEIVSVFAGQGTREQRETIYNIVFPINPSQNTYWEELKK